MKQIYTLVLFSLLSALTFEGVAQQQTMFFMENNPYSKEINPAIINNKGKFYIGLPGLSSIDFSTNTNGYAYNDLIHYGTGQYADSLIMDLDGFNDVLKDQNYLMNEYSYGILNFGFRIKEKNYFTFSINQNMFSQSRFDQDIVTTMLEGNANHLGETLDFGLAVNMIHYNELALGYSYEYDNNWTFGATLKLLSGMGAARTQGLNLGITTATDASEIDLLSSGTIQISGPVEYNLDEDGMVDEIENNFDIDYLIPGKNLGVAIDLGASYKFDDKINAGVSIVDLGSITWTNQVSTLQQQGHFIYKGVDISNSLDETNPNYEDISDTFENLVDSISDSFRFADGRAGKFKTSLPTKVYLNGEYILNESVSFGALTRLRFLDDHVGGSLTLSVNTDIQDWLTFTASYGMLEGSYDNLGIALGVRAGAVHYFLSSDNILGAVNPSGAKVVNARMGINFLFGRGE